MQRNITMSMDETLLKKARKIASERNTSVSELIRKYLKHLIEKEENRRQGLASELDHLFNQANMKIGDKKWTRDELYER